MVQLKKSYFFYPILILCIGIDIYSNFGLGKPLLSTLLCLFSVATSYSLTNIRLAILLILLGIESFVYYSQWGAQLTYLIPIAATTKRTWKIFNSPVYHACFVLVACLCAQICIDFFRGNNVFSIFTFLKIFVNIIITISLSLTYE
jgi:hypothetical protein